MDQTNCSSHFESSSYIVDDFVILHLPLKLCSKITREKQKLATIIEARRGRDRITVQWRPFCNHSSIRSKKLRARENAHKLYTPLQICTTIFTVLTTTWISRSIGFPKRFWSCEGSHSIIASFRKMKKLTWRHRYCTQRAFLPVLAPIFISLER
ncbi:uncharacterized protein [Euphorbia lathyris]|uniref:uncharacterized protein isoform X2 n=1 Tax=Euphorbia lathyris TaxID=212925 RepID=UPI003313AC3E